MNNRVYGVVVVIQKNCKKWSECPVRNAAVYLLLLSVRGELGLVPPVPEGVLEAIRVPLPELIAHLANALADARVRVVPQLEQAPPRPPPLRLGLHLVELRDRARKVLHGLFRVVPSDSEESDVSYGIRRKAPELMQEGGVVTYRRAKRSASYSCSLSKPTNCDLLISSVVVRPTLASASFTVGPRKILYVSSVRGHGVARSPHSREGPDEGADHVHAETKDGGPEYLLMREGFKVVAEEEMGHLVC